jgi:hypothetical protein
MEYLDTAESLPFLFPSLKARNTLAYATNGCPTMIYGLMVQPRDQ